MAISLAIQLGLLAITSLLFAGGFLLGLQHMRRLQTAGSESRQNPRLPHEASMGAAARIAVAVGICMGFILLAWRALSAGMFTLALRNPLDAFLVLGLLLALTVAWFRWTRHLRSLSFFLLPMVVILLLSGLILTAVHFSDFASPPTGDAQYLNAWTQLHVITIVTGTLCFALACVGAVVYLLADRQLKRKGLDASHRWIGLPPLASIEKFNRWMIYAGFPLLTIATGAGILRAMEVAASGHLKMVLGTLAWLVYAVLLQVPLNPRFRGRSTAWLTIAGFVLFMAAFAAARWS